MPATLVKPVSLQCACPGCHCSLTPETSYRIGDKLFCSEACAKGHPRGEPCCAKCDCNLPA